MLDSSSMAILAVPAILFLVVIYFLLPRKAGGDKAPPLALTSTVKIPLIGRILEFATGPTLMVDRCVKEFGHVFTIPLANQRLTFLIGPEASSAFCKASDDVLSQNEVYGFMKPIFGPGVVYDATKKNRQVQFQNLATGLRANRLKSYVEKIEVETRRYLKQEWGNEGEIDLLHSLGELTILTASRCLHGNDVRENLFKEVSELYHDLDQGLTPLTIFWPNAPIPVHWKRDKARTRMVELFSKVIANRRKNPDDAKYSDGTDVLSLFAKIKYKDGTPISDEQITGLLIALLFAGQHTSCITSTWAALHLANNPDAMKTALDEQNTFFPVKKDEAKQNEPHDALDFDKINSMEFLHNCVKESLRLSPPLILLIRMALRDLPVTVGDKSYVVPKGDMVVLCPGVSMRLPEVFSNPHDFDPHRYGPGREEDKSSPFAYMAFGGGLHSCMGQNFGYLQVKTIISILIREYHMELVAGKMPEIDKAAMVVGPKGDCRVRYKRRTVSSN